MYLFHQLSVRRNIVRCFRTKVSRLNSCGCNKATAASTFWRSPASSPSELIKSDAYQITRMIDVAPSTHVTRLRKPRFLGAVDTVLACIGSAHSSSASAAPQRRHNWSALLLTNPQCAHFRLD